MARFVSFVRAAVAAGGSGPGIGDGLLLADGTSFALLETADFILLE